MAVPRDKLEASALASGLVTRADIDKALDSLRAEQEHAARPTSEFTGEQLAAKLIEFGKINFWQAEQLFAGKRIFQLGPYRIVDSIGKGGMGEVYKGEHTLMKRVVAIKVLPRHRATPENVANFIREIQAQAQLDHENLVRAHDAGEDNGVHYLVTEFVPGQDLRKLIRKSGRLSMSAASSLVAQAAIGLDHAHKRGMIHRDVKPGNMLVTPDGRCKVSDLGLADYFNDEEVDTERATKIVGTADYLAPELILNPELRSPSCDIYALGCTLYYAVTGKVPYPGGTTSEKARAHLTVHPLDPRRLNPGLSDDFVDLIAALMVKDPSERIPSASEVAAQLAPWISDRDSSASAPWAEGPASTSTHFSSVGRHAHDPIDLGETRPLVEDAVYADALVEEASQSSQISQPTWPMTGMMQDTSVMYGGMMPRQEPYDRGGMSSGTLILVIVGLALAFGVIVAMLVLQFIL